MASLLISSRWVLLRGRDGLPRFGVCWAQVGLVVFGGGVVRGAGMRLGLLSGLQIGDLAWAFWVDLMKVGDGGGAWVGAVCRTVHRSY